MYFNDSNKKYIILDIEGNSAKQEDERKMTQFSALVFHNNQFIEIDYMNRNVNYINPYVKKMTKISVNTCKNNGMSERNMVFKIHELLKTCDVIYAYGCDFDKKIINIMFNKYNLSPINALWIDVIDDVKKYLNPSKLKLSIAANEYGFVSCNFHNALVDCYATLHLMKTIMQIREATL